MLERVGRKGNPLTLLVGMQTSTATMENCGDSLNTGNRTAIPVHSKEDQPWDLFGRNDAKAETPVLWPPHAKS